MCEISIYQYFLQAVGLVTLALLIGSVIFIAANPERVGNFMDHDKKGGRK